MPLLQTVPTIEDTNITKAKLLADKDIVICYLEYGRMQDLRDPTSRALGELHAVQRLGVATRVLGRFGCMLPREIFLNGTIWCILEHIFINF